MEVKLELVDSGNFFAVIELELEKGARGIPSIQRVLDCRVDTLSAVSSEGDLRRQGSRWISDVPIWRNRCVRRR